MSSKLVIQIVRLLILQPVSAIGSKLHLYISLEYVLSRSPLIRDKSAVVALAYPITAGFVSLLLFFPWTRIWGLYGSILIMPVLTRTPQLPEASDGVLKQTNVSTKKFYY